MKHLTFFALAALPTSALSADLEEVTNDLIVPSISAFVTAANALSATAADDCTASSVRPAYDAAFDAWLPVSVYRLGPTEAGSLTIAFWPDEKGLTPKALRALIAGSDPAVLTPEAMSTSSAATRGFLALDQMLGDAELSAYSAGSYSCDLVRAISADIAAQAVALAAAWEGGFAKTLLEPGSEGNTTYLTEEEAVKAIYTQLLSSIEFAKDSRVGRPLGTFDKPRPTRAEAWRTARPARNIDLTLKALQPLAHELAETELPATDAAFKAAHDALSALRDPTLQDIGDSGAWLKAEIVQQRLGALYDAVEAEVGKSLALEPGFNSLDGD